jgi:hypothetical protein
VLPPDVTNHPRRIHGLQICHRLQTLLSRRHYTSRAMCCQKAKKNAVPSKAHDHSFRPYGRKKNRRRGVKYSAMRFSDCCLTKEQPKESTPGVACIPLSTSLSISPNKTRVEASKLRDRYLTRKFLESLKYRNTCVRLEDRRCLGRVLEQALSASPMERFKHNSIAKKDKSSSADPFPNLS